MDKRNMLNLVLGLITGFSGAMKLFFGDLIKGIILTIIGFFILSMTDNGGD